MNNRQKEELSHMEARARLGDAGAMHRLAEWFRGKLTAIDLAREADPDAEGAIS